MLNRWRQIQAQEYDHGQAQYQQTGSYFGFFSVPEFHVTNQIADRLAHIAGPVLDVGCGLLPMPNYLKQCRHPFGLDPYLGQPRQFPFCQATAEAIPFKAGYFAAALLMSAVDHLIDPTQTANEISRVLGSGGLLFIWYISRAKVDGHHLWAFDRARLLQLFDNFAEIDFVAFGGDKKVGFPKTEMVVLKK